MITSARRRRFTPARGDRPLVFAVASALWAVLLIVLAAQSDTLSEFGLESGRRGTVRYLTGSAVLGLLVSTFLRAVRPTHFGPTRTLIATLLATSGATVAGVLARNLFSAQGLSSSGARLEVAGAIAGALLGTGVSMLVDRSRRRWWRGAVGLTTAVVSLLVVGTFAIVDAGPVGRTAASCGSAWDDPPPDSGYARRFDLAAVGTDSDRGGFVVEGRVAPEGSGLRFDGGLAASATLGKEIAQAAVSADQVTVSAWIIPGSLSQQGPARIVSVSNGISQREVNLHLGLVDGTVSFRVRTRCSLFNWVNTRPVLDSTDTPRHIAASYAGGFARVWIDAELILEQDIGAGSLDNWDPAFPLVLGNEATGDRPFQGDLLDLAIYGYALNDEEIRTLYDAGRLRG